MSRKKHDRTPFHIIKSGIIYELRSEPSGGYTISIPSLQGCITFGESIEEALAMIADAMEGWLWVAAQEGLYIPDEFVPLVPAGVRRRRKAS
jgi:predicted RNase H-like HicB family nuclease